ncbi:hypothetical protein JCM12298_02030 [Desulfothermus naphthae]
MSIKSLIENFSIDTLKDFFREKIYTFSIEEENYEYLFENNFNILNNYEDILKIGEANLENSDEIIVIAAKTLAPLTNKTGKKRQYEIAKKILKYENKDASFFIFYDDNGNFRFSFIKANYQGTKRNFTDFKRYTYFVSPKQTNKTFINRISKCNFENLDSIQDAFSVEPVTKEFYTKLQRWYFWAIKNVKFPEDAEKEKNGREIAIIRLITRLMFVWFMKVRGLIPDELFDKEEIGKILKDFSDEESTYYKAILQNLFFATLNTKQNERKFRREVRGHKGYNPDYGNQNVFRYHNLFKESVFLENLFKEIPFLNGGLFECLDYKSKISNERKYIDGFTDTKKYQPKVPNFLFFSDPIKVDLADFFREKKKTYEVEGLINILKSYNFTIDENEPDDVEIALDPELLGSIFENLLASYNPETATTARKATGSFYTPREIVNYMTEESLKQYFKTHLKDMPSIDEKLDLLIKSDNSKNPFDEQTTKKVIDLINDLRVVDPAVGSGAFPMAMLNKLVFILGKLDPKNQYWKESQIESIKKSIKDPVLQHKLTQQIEKQFKEKNADYGRKLYLIEKCIYGVDIQQIAVEIAKLRFFISLLVDEEIDKAKENCGVEPLPNLDFKLMQGNSLISTFAGIDFSNNKREKYKVLHFQGIEPPYKKIIKEFEDLKHQYQYEPNNKKKRELRDKINEKIIEIFQTKISGLDSTLKDIEERAKKIPKEQREIFIKEEKQKLNKKLGFDIEQVKKDLIAYTEGRKQKDFFLWDVYFAEVFSQKRGFDIVIGNPPYIQLQKAVNNKQKFADLYKNENYKTFERTGDIYTLFYEKGIKILNRYGLLCFITSNKWMRANYGKSLRKFLSKHTPLKLIDLGPGIFNTATVDTNILLIAKKDFSEKNHHRLKALTLAEKDKINTLTDKDFTILTDLNEENWIILSPQEQKIKEKIERIGTPLKDWDIQINYGIKTGYNKAFIIDGKTKDELIRKDPKSAEIIKPILRGRDIKRYKAEFADLWLINTHNGYKNSKGEYIPPIDVREYPAIKEHLDKYWDKLKKRQDKGITPYNLRNCAYLEEFENEKIVYQEIVRYAEFYYDINGYFPEATTFIITGKFIKFLIANLNSKPVTYFFRKFYAGGGLGEKGFRYKKAFLINLPIPLVSKSQQKPFETIVDKILIKKERGEDTTKEEQQIDLMVYKLYELTYDEVKIVDPEFPLTKEEYDKFSIEQVEKK